MVSRAQGTIEAPFGKASTQNKILLASQNPRFCLGTEKSIAQGTIEYLMIIAVVIVISLVVVGLVVTQVGNSSDVSGTSSEIKQKVGVSGLSLGSSVAGVDGNGLLVLKNIDVGNLTLSKIIVDGVNHNYSTQIVAGDQKSFKLKSISSCVGKNKNYSVKVEYVSASGLTKVADFGNILLDCTSVTTPVGVAIEQKIDCTGGTITYFGGYTIHTFLVSGTLTCPSSLTAEVLVIGGGGGAGTSNGGYRGGGGGAGGLIYNSNHSVQGGTYSIVVGDGGSVGVNGSNSSFNSLVAIGGGRGGNANNGAGQIGGSGGGAAAPSGSPGDGTVGQGYAGGSASGGYNGGAGGSAGGTPAPGYTASCPQADGFLSNISGVDKNYAVGGMATYYCTAPVIVSNSGNGGHTTNAGSTVGQAGIVIVRYLTN